MVKCYELLFQRNSTAQEHRWKFIQWSLLGILAFYAGIFNVTNNVSAHALKIIIWFPVPLCVLGLALAWGIRRGMKERGLVMKAIEEAFEFDGWEKVREQVVHRAFVPSPLATVTYLYWSVMLIITVAVGIAANLGWLFVAAKG